MQFELRYNEVERARAVYERYVDILPSVKAWVRYAKFELQHNDVLRARSCYERAMEALGEEAHTVSGWSLAETYFLRQPKSKSCLVSSCACTRYLVPGGHLSSVLGSSSIACFTCCHCVSFQPLHRVPTASRPDDQVVAVCSHIAGM